MQELRGKTAVVTGGGSGIGRGIALALAGEGMNIVIADVREASAEAVAQEARQIGPGALAVQTDVRRGSDVDQLADAAFGEFGRVELLVQVAGVLHAEPPEETSEDDWRWVFEVNTFGIANGCRSFVPRMMSQGDECHIVNTSSLAGLVPLRLPHFGLYTASKYAATGFTEILRNELAPHGIGVSLLVPGRVRTDLAATSAEIRPSEYGGPLPAPRDDGAQATSPAATLEPGADDERVVWEPADAGALVVEGIGQNWAYIVTNPRFTRRLVEHRASRIMTDMAKAERFQDDVLLPRLRG